MIREVRGHARSLPLAESAELHDKVMFTCAHRAHARAHARARAPFP